MKQEPIYDVSYFIKKFEAIPEELWFVGNYSNSKSTKFCAYGHCGLSDSVMKGQNPEGDSLAEILDNDVAAINDKEDKRYQQSTPKQRILAPGST